MVEGLGRVRVMPLSGNVGIACASSCARRVRACGPELEECAKAPTKREADDACGDGAHVVAARSIHPSPAQGQATNEKSGQAPAGKEERA
jgi:hypothetical protein